MSVLRIHLLGSFHLVYDGTSLTSVHSPRVQSLLTYLLLHRHTPQPRQQLAFLFWPDTTHSQARNNLRQTLHQLRGEFPGVDHFMDSEPSTLIWRSEVPFDLDVADFEEEILKADSAERLMNQSATQTALEQAANLYQGDLLPGCYDEWILPEREQLHQQYLRVLERLVRLLEEQRDYALAIQYAQQLLRDDPVHEDTYLRLIRLHALNHNRAAALRTYHTCVSTLEHELGVKPGASTREAYERLLHMDMLASSMPERIPSLAAMTDLIGRQPEWKQLQAVWQQASGGNAHFVLLTGDAGIGKSRLAEELLEWAGQQGIATARTRAYAAEGRLSYAPVAEWLRSIDLRPALSRLDNIWLSEVARLLPELVVGGSDIRMPEPLSDYWQRQRFFEGLAQAMVGAHQPLLLLIDDLQWCDQDTLEWLHYLLRFDPGACLLIVGTARTEAILNQYPLKTLLFDLRTIDCMTEIMLEAFDAADTAKLAAGLAGRDLSPEQTLQLYQETEGNPLFVVETLRAGLGSGGRKLPSKDQTRTELQPGEKELELLPPKVYAVIASRLAQLSAPARELAALAATVGRAFTLDVLAQASNGDEDSLVRGLDELWQRRIVREQGVNAYDFSHDKLREVAYVEITPARRRLLHRRVGQALEIVYAADLDPVSDQVAAHYENAGLLEHALPYYQRAAAVAQRVYANQQAIDLLRRGLEVLRKLPQSTDRDGYELDLQTALGVSLVATRGYPASEVMEVYSRAWVLCQQLRNPPSPPILRALAIASVTYLDLGRAEDLGNQLLSLAEHDRDPILFTEAHYVLGVTSFWQGSLIASRMHLEEAIAHYNPAQSRLHISMYSQDPKVVCLCRLSFVLECLGYPDQATQRIQEALTVAQKVSHPFSLAYALNWAAILHHHRRELPETQADAEAAVALCREHHLDSLI